MNGFKSIRRNKNNKYPIIIPSVFRKTSSTSVLRPINNCTNSMIIVTAKPIEITFLKELNFVQIKGTKKPIGENNSKFAVIFNRIHHSNHQPLYSLHKNTDREYEMVLGLPLIFH